MISISFQGNIYTFNNSKAGDFPDGPVVDSILPTQGAWVWSLVRELRTHMPCSMGKKRKEKKKSKALVVEIIQREGSQMEGGVWKEVK